MHDSDAVVDDGVDDETVCCIVNESTLLDAINGGCVRTCLGLLQLLLLLLLLLPQ